MAQEIEVGEETTIVPLFVVTDLEVPLGSVTITDGAEDESLAVVGVVSPLVDVVPRAAPPAPPYAYIV
jgi:hypothetical protein